MKTFQTLVKENINSLSSAELRKVKMLLKKDNPKADDQAMDIMLQYFKDPDDAFDALDRLQMELTKNKRGGPSPNTRKKKR
jgi:uncharacterized membrane protein YvbJ